MVNKKKISYNIDHFRCERFFIYLNFSNGSDNFRENSILKNPMWKL